MALLERVAPHTVGVRAEEVQKFVKEVSARYGIHRFMLLRHGKVAAEGNWAPYVAEDAHVLFSMSKTFTSTAIGFAVQEGLLSLNDKVLSFFPDVLPNAPCANMQKMEVCHLLMMATGHSVEPDVLQTTDFNWVYRFLTSYVDQEPGTVWCYNTPATYMLSAILQRVTGLHLADYLKPRLFDPLGFENYWWEASPEGIDCGGYGLNVRIEDLAKFGQFYLNRGSWEGKQLLNAAWIDEAAALHMPSGGADSHVEGKQGYGYQIWRCTPEGAYRGDGAFGQYCVVMPEQDAVLAIHSGEENMHEIIALFFNMVLGGFCDGIDANEVAEKALLKTCSTLKIAPPEGMRLGVQQQRYSEKRYVFPPNELSLRLISMKFGKDPMLHMVLEGETVTVPVGYGRWVTKNTGVVANTSCIGKWVYPQAAVVGAWRTNSYLLKIAYVQTPYIDSIRMFYDEKGVMLRFQRNVSFGKREFELYGREVE